MQIMTNQLTEAQFSACQDKIDNARGSKGDQNMAKQIESLRTQSEQAWEMAVETAGPEYSGGSTERAEAMQSLADACGEAWQRAADALDADDFAAALAALEEARGLESEGGNDSHARSAIEALTLPALT